MTGHMTAWQRLPSSVSIPGASEHIKPNLGKIAVNLSDFIIAKIHAIWPCPLLLSNFIIFVADRLHSKCLIFNGAICRTLLLHYTGLCTNNKV